MRSIVGATARSPIWLLVSWVTIFLVGTDLFIVSSFLPSIARELRTSPASLAILVSAFSVAYAVACPVQGWVAERLGLRTVLIAGVTSLGLANLYTAMAPDLLRLTVSRVLAGFAAAAISPVLYALTADRAAPAQRASRLALVNSGLVISLCLGAPLGLVIGDMTNWRTVFVGLATVLLIMAPINAATWSPRTTRTPAIRVAISHEQVWNALPLLVCMVAWSASVYATYTLIAMSLSQDFRASAQGIASTLACFGAGATAGVLGGGRLADHIGAGRVVRLSLLLMSAAFALCHAAYRTHVPGVLATALFAVSFAAYGFFPAIQACAARMFTAQRPTVLGLMSSALYVGITLGASLGASVFESLGMGAVLIMSAMIALGGFLVSLQGTAFAPPRQEYRTT